MGCLLSAPVSDDRRAAAETAVLAEEVKLSELDRDAAHACLARALRDTSTCVGRRPDDDGASLVETVADRLRRLDAHMSCAVCMDAPRCAVSLPCAHLVLCAECVSSYGSSCIVCDAPIDSFLYVFPV